MGHQNMTRVGIGVCFSSFVLVRLIKARGMASTLHQAMAAVWGRLVVNKPVR
jgi:hypothetical protein